MITQSTPELAEIRSRWGWFVGLGVLLVIFGIIILGNLVASTLVTTILVGVLLVAAGIAEFVGAFGTRRSVPARLLHLLLGVLYVIVGLNIATDPLAGAITLTVVIAILLVADGVIRLVEALAYRPPHWGIVAVVAVINILLGLWIWSGIPVSGIAIGLFVGLEVIMAGISWIALGWLARGPAQELPGPQTT